jgi:hypothetical protein
MARSSNAFSNSISGSISPEEKSSEEAYRDDVRVATRAFVGSGASADAFQRQLGGIAERHGISHWEGEPGTWVAIGAGLGEAGIPESEVDAVLLRLGPLAAQDRVLALEGFRSATL